MQIRPARPEDRSFVLSLAHRFAEFELPPWLDAAAVAEGTADQLAAAIEHADHRSSVLIAEDGEEPAGFAWVHTIPDFYGSKDLAKISEIAVTRDGGGAGSRLMEACEAWAVERGCERLVLNVIEGNLHARGFYAAHGFEPEYTMLVKPLGGRGKRSEDG